MKKLKLTLLVSSLALSMLSGNVLGEAGISYNSSGDPADVTAQVKFKITIPKIMILRVGDWAGSVNTVEWNYAFGTSLSDPSANVDATADHWNKTGSPSSLAATSDDESETDKAGDGILKVAAFGNTGADLSLSATSTDFTSTTASGNQPHLSEITAANTGNITHPTLVNSGQSAAVTLANANGVVREFDTWAYTYTPASVPAGGVYTASVVYTLATL